MKELMKFISIYDAIFLFVSASVSVMFMMSSDGVIRLILICFQVGVILGYLLGGKSWEKVVRNNEKKLRQLHILSDEP
jgi:uncharacterized membrane protein YciS (DUF1049 family)